MNNQEKIILNLINRQFHYKRLVQDLITQKEKLLLNEDPVFHDDIKNEFKKNVMERIIDDITLEFALPIDDVLFVVQNLNLDEYLSF